MFPYTCLATMPLFCHVDWPRKFENWFKSNFTFNINSYTKIQKFDFKSMLQKLIDLTEKSIEKSGEESKNLQNYEETENFPPLNSAEEKSTKLSQEREDISTLKNAEKEIIEEKIEKEENEEKSISVWKNIPQVEEKKVTKKQKFVVSLLLLHIGLQFFLPYSHFITKVNYLLI